MKPDIIISADSHFIEPADLWTERLDTKFRDRAPKTVIGSDGIEYLYSEDYPPFQMKAGALFTAGKSSAELPEMYNRGWAAAPPSVYDPSARLTEMAQDGTSAEVLYATQAMLFMGMKDAELLMACFRVFNDWAADYCKYDTNRLIGAGCICLDDIPAAVAELKRVEKLGLHSVMIPVSPPSDMAYSLPRNDPFWAAAEEMGIVLALHGGATRDGISFGPKEMIRRYIEVPNYIQVTLAEIIVGGTFERFPNLRIATPENDVGWAPFFLERLDHGAERFSRLAGVKLKNPPSYYFRQNIFGTFCFETVGVEMAARSWSVDNLMFSSDYPHPDSTWPHSVEQLRKSMASFSDEDQAKMTYLNAAKLYDIDLTSLDGMKVPEIAQMN